MQLSCLLLFFVHILISIYKLFKLTVYVQPRISLLSLLDRRTSRHFCHKMSKSSRCISIRNKITNQNLTCSWNSSNGWWPSHQINSIIKEEKHIILQNRSHKIELTVKWTINLVTIRKIFMSCAPWQQTQHGNICISIKKKNNRSNFR